MRAIAHEVGKPGRGRPVERLTFPLIGQDRDPRVEVTNADIAAAVEAEDVEQYGR